MLNCRRGLVYHDQNTARHRLTPPDTTKHRVFHFKGCETPGGCFGVSGYLFLTPFLGFGLLLDGGRAAEKKTLF